MSSTVRAQRRIASSLERAGASLCCQPQRAYRASGLDATRGPGIADKQQGINQHHLSSGNLSQWRSINPQIRPAVESARTANEALMKIVGA
jgi:hypothetical protein